MTELFMVAAHSVEAAGVLLLLIGLLVSFGRFLKRISSDADKSEIYRAFRREVGRNLLLCLEFLVAADIISTVAVKTTIETLTTLGMLVVIRTFLSFSLEVELTGHWPWQSRKTEPTEP